MPNQELSNVVPQIMAQGLFVLRKNAMLPRVITRSYESDARAYGDTIDIPIIDVATVVAVSPAATYPTAVTVQPTKKQLALDWWREVSFVLEDKELEEANAGILPMRASAALAALANAVDAKIGNLYKDFPNWGGVGGTTPFASTATAFLDAREALNLDLAPVGGRVVVLGAAAEALALGIPQFYQAHMAGDQEGIKQGQIGYK
ncbi:MAG: P22 phage major capsid protein family protein, partial [Planctomycetota bacterium]